MLKHSSLSQGVLLYELATGCLPFTQTSDPAATPPPLPEEYEASLLGRVMRGLVLADSAGRWDIREALELLSGE